MTISFCMTYGMMTVLYGAFSVKDEFDLTQILEF